MWRRPEVPWVGPLPHMGWGGRSPGLDVTSSGSSGAVGPRVVWSSESPWSVQASVVRARVGQGLPSAQWVLDPVREFVPPLLTTLPLPRPPLPVEAAHDRTLLAMDVGSQRRRHREGSVDCRVEAMLGASAASGEHQESEASSGQGEIFRGVFFLRCRFFFFLVCVS